MAERLGNSQDEFTAVRRLWDTYCSIRAEQGIDMAQLLAFVTATLGQNHAPSPPSGDWEHTLWIDGTLTAIESIEVGSPAKN